MQIDMLAPDFTLAATDTSKFTLSNYRSKIIILYFYPKDNTPGCTQEGKDFNDHYAEFKQLGAEIFGISRDSIDSHEKFKAECAFKFALLSDTNSNVCEQYKVLKEKSMFGKKSIGIERSTFIIDQNGKIVFAWRNVKIPGHVLAVLEKVTKLVN